MKISICVSGQTRSWNDHPSNNLQYFISVLEQMGHTVNVVGHTWDNCDTPTQDLVQFKNIELNRSSIIDEWIKQDWYNRVIIDNDLCDYFEYKQITDFPQRIDMAYDRIPEYIRTDMLEWSRNEYAQHISGWKSFQLADNDSDIYLRWRWDLVFNTLSTDLDEEDYKNNIDYWTENLNDLFTYVTDHRSEDFYFCGSSLILTGGQAIVDDQYFIFTNKAKQKIDNINIFEAIDAYAAFKDYDMTRTAEQHLWKFINIGLTELSGLTMLPPMARTTYSPHRGKRPQRKYA
jgi:hypothetical protein